MKSPSRSISTERLLLPNQQLHPSAPQNLQYTSTTDSVTVTWDAVEGATSYKVYRGADKVFYKEVTDPTCTLTEIAPDTLLTVNVTAVNSAGESPMSAISTRTQPSA
ncbi:fibronectin type III domain-containing protein [Bacillus licheniformis]|uniref:fibronectin type III domain-containing protein n=1 Tax=Bacillus licheniformis TaxID=1402 RepID=UPI000DFC2FD9|nr:fibronectin type III domain-containing protein [Bacillus licheniformis]MCA1183490.1 fibronectin type III domain-containing protein [Bacillus licheniformis]MCY7740869.1 fibronectin type III domain-containing protein [Bacillus licheniformis]MDH3162309.1 fibronectin type III domain-containing protein [Bacillus licheniformis]QDL76945.1 fibronectin type III domain-containing protein [Bacillus licheniformis]RCK12332.1 fibronectin type III domain-containing protein [Bacillus licheniformis]